MDWVEATSAAFLKMLLTTEHGQKLLHHRLNLTAKIGEDTKEYTLIDNVTLKTKTLKNSQVWFLQGCLVDGMPTPLAEHRDENFIPALELEISDLERIKCDGCGIVSHCSKEVLDPGTDRLLQLCNFCLTYHEHPRIRDSGSHSICGYCTVTTCGHNPRQQNKANRLVGRY